MCRQRVYLMGRQAIIPKLEGRAAIRRSVRDTKREREKESKKREGEKKRVSV